MHFESSNNSTTRRGDLSLFFQYYYGLAMKLFKDGAEKDVPDALSQGIISLCATNDSTN